MSLPESTSLVAASLFEQGWSGRKVAKELGISPASACALKHQALLDPSLIHHVSKHISNKLLLVSNGSADELLDRVADGKLKDVKAVDLAKMASIALQAATAYATVSGAKDTISALFSQYGIEPAHSVSKVTMKQEVSVELENRSNANNATTGCMDAAFSIEGKP